MVDEVEFVVVISAEVPARGQGDVALGPGGLGLVTAAALGHLCAVVRLHGVTAIHTPPPLTSRAHSRLTAAQHRHPAAAPRPAPRSPHWPRHPHRRTGTGVGLLHGHIPAMSDDVIQSLVYWLFGY